MQTLLLSFLVTCAASTGGVQQADSLVIEVGGRITVLHSLAGLPRETVLSTFHGGPAQRYSGVSLRALLERAGLVRSGARGAALARYVVVEARDGYRVLLGVADLDTSIVAHSVLLADSADGRPLPANESPWRLVVAGDRGGARSARMVIAIRVRDAGP